MRRRASGLLMPLLIGLALHGCKSRDWNEEIVDIRGSTDCILIVFEEGVDPEAIERFFNQHVRVEYPGDNGGWRFREGLISNVRRSTPAREAYEVCFAPDADRALRAEIRNEIEAAPEVSQVEMVQMK